MKPRTGRTIRSANSPLNTMATIRAAAASTVEKMARLATHPAARLAAYMVSSLRLRSRTQISRTRKNRVYTSF